MRPIGPAIAPPNNPPPNNPPPNNPPPNNPPDRGAGPSAADEAAARRLLSSGDTSLNQNDVASAVTALAQAQRLVGRRHAGAGALRTSIERKGSNMVGNLLQRGDCPGAQNLFRQLRTVGAEGRSRDQFSPDWCARP
jgi:hypothetical protein